MKEEILKERTKTTAARLFSGPVEVEVPYQLWKEFDSELARELSLFITGNMYSRTVLTLAERQVVAVSALAALGRTEELRIHLHGALNVGVSWKTCAEAIFQVGVYAGFPVVNAALATLKAVLQERGQWPPSDGGSEEPLA
ncbi:4-carboxymuconolactone decarboxylase [Desulfacinum infernum DSM 9756]|uniref:4-carboxymuconolactone decarboxylase n=1 Tax=Desulfacinum infernum DSM 9756 TaxID=1121391 RepID=A0A1M5G1Z5_9BACT|nr:carboxymuconolactone decarboxylase family protein [Desulfacinum infernum]SHF97471.1 4-carboxymuconolactone decarboxylase [Desulfacinum infernum DSM 9756]